MNVLTFKAERLAVTSSALVLAIGLYSNGVAFGKLLRRQLPLGQAFPQIGAHPQGRRMF